MELLLKDLLILLFAAVVSLAVASLAYTFLVRNAVKLAKRTKTVMDDHLVNAMEKPVYFAVLIIGLNWAVEYTSFAGLAVRAVLFRIAVILLLAYGLLKLVDAVLAWYKEEIEAKQHSRLGDLIPTARKIILFVVVAIAGTMILQSVGIEITPIIAALGIGGLAVALAFQDTLSNFFAGITITLDRPIKVGDFIELENGTKGVVVSIGWRSTQIRTLPNNLVIVSNNKLSQMQVTNYSLPTNSLNIVVPCSVAYGSDLEKVEKVTIEAARTVQRNIKGTVPQFDPFIRYNSFGENGIGFSIILSVQQFTDQYLVLHEFVKELSKQYEKNGIVIPFPQRTMHMLDEKPKKVSR